MTSDYNIYHYVPSLSGNIIFLAFFIITAIGHVYKLATRKTKFFIPLLIGNAFEIGGFIIRLASRSNTGSITLYAIQSVLIIIAPVLFAASMYMTISRLVFYLDSPEVALIKPRLVTKIFVTSDVVCFLLQAGGSGMMASSGSSSVGSKIVMVGLAIQLIFFSLYILVLIVAHRRLKEKEITCTPGKFQYPALFWALYVSCALIVVRSIYRLVEFSQGWDGYVITHEAYSLVFDALPMFLTCLVLFVIHPSDVMVSPFSGRSTNILMSDNYEMTPRRFSES